MGKKYFKQKICGVCLVLILTIGMSIITSATPVAMADGQLFDEVYYLQQCPGLIVYIQQNPGVVELYGGQTQFLYQNYLLCGKNIGLLPYNPNPSIPVSVTPQPVVTDSTGNASYTGYYGSYSSYQAEKQREWERYQKEKERTYQENRNKSYNERRNSYTNTYNTHRDNNNRIYRKYH